MKRAQHIIVITAILLLQACVNVQPWERAVLAKKEMSPQGDSIINGLDDHIYFSKEGSSGGRSFGGGGCGCN